MVGNGNTLDIIDVRERLIGDLTAARHEFLSIATQATAEYLKGERDIIPEHRTEVIDAEQRWHEAKLAIDEFVGDPEQ